jgi:transcription antitermination factor NusG
MYLNRYYAASNREPETKSSQPPLAWYPLQTRYQCEKRVDIALREQGFETFSPVNREKRQWSDRRKLVESPLFPGYGFVRMEATSKSLSKILRLPGLVRLMTNGRELLSVTNEEIESLRTLVHCEAHFEPVPFPAVGERVRIRGGCLEGVEGVLVSTPERGQIVVSVGVIQRALKVALAGYRIERL